MQPHPALEMWTKVGIIAGIIAGVPLLLGTIKLFYDDLKPKKDAAQR